MRYLNRIITITLLSVALISCKKEGCTDCNAINYDSDADNDDNSCQYVNEEFLGVYNVQDSIIGPPSMEWNHNTYDLTIIRSTCSPNNLTISNYADKNNSFSGTTFNVDCLINNNSITILDQAVNNDNVRNSAGYFTNDSIYFDIEFENEFGEVFYGKCFGKKY